VELGTECCVKQFKKMSLYIALSCLPSMWNWVQNAA